MTDENMLGEFLSEFEEVIQRVSEKMEMLEKGEYTPEHISEFYRDMHTLKGTAQLLGYSNIAKISHVLEAALGPVREDDLKIKQPLLDHMHICLRLLDELKTLLMQKGHDSGIADMDQKVSQAFHRLVMLTADNFVEEFKSPSESLLLDSMADRGGLKKEWTHKKDQEDLNLEKTIDVEESPSLEVVTPDVEHQEVATTDSQEISLAEEPKLDQRSLETVSEDFDKGATVADNVNKAVPQSAEPQPESGNISLAANAPAAAASETVRVQVELLDKLMNLAGELVLVRNQVLQFSGQSENLDLINLSQNLNVVTSDIQEEVMKTRMQPVGNVLNKFQRLVRDIARDIDKKIDVTLTGVETELDKTLLEAIKDPLTHIVRNSCDHGIEMPADRMAAGKDESGHIKVSAFHEGGQVVIEVADDGRGLSKEKLINKAIQNGILDEARAEKMSSHEIYNLIFHPGFSTAEKVSALSGRGVGMDVVRTNIEKIGGNVELDSSFGKGTSIRLKIPLTLAVVPVMLVRSGEDRLAIPQVKLVELVRVEKSDDENQGIEFLQGNPIYRLRGDLLTLVSLKDVLSGSGGAEEIKRSVESGESINIVVLNADGNCFGLVVDEILDTADIVVKPLSQFLKGLSVFSGATIMGDGSVALILDVMGTANMASLDFTGRERTSSRADDLHQEMEISDVMEFLLFDTGAAGKNAIPLCLVNRLEEFSRDDIEISGEQEVVQYRDAILPLVSLEKYLGLPETEEPESNHVVAIVAKRGELYFGIKVKSILDVVTINKVIDDNVKDRPGILGNVIHNDEVVVVIDFLGIMNEEAKRLRHSFAPPDGEAPVEPVMGVQFEDEADGSLRGIEVLLAEDTPFFRRQIVKVLVKHGCEVTVAGDGSEALRILNKSEAGHFKLIVSDIEMPNLDGFGLAEKVRESEVHSKVPMIALTTRFSQRDIEKGHKAGFNLYLEKMNEDQLVNGLNGILKAKGA